MPHLHSPIIDNFECTISSPHSTSSVHFMSLLVMVPAYATRSTGNPFSVFIPYYGLHRTDINDMVWNSAVDSYPSLPIYQFALPHLNTLTFKPDTPRHRSSLSSTIPFPPFSLNQLYISRFILKSSVYLIMHRLTRLTFTTVLPLLFSIVLGLSPRVPLSVAVVENHMLCTRKYKKVYAM